VTPIKAEAVGLKEISDVPEELLAPVEVKSSVLVLVTSAAENSVFVIVIVGEPFAP